jgi:hypothetical protein
MLEILVDHQKLQQKLVSVDVNIIKVSLQNLLMCFSFAGNNSIPKKERIGTKIGKISLLFITI